MGREQVALAGMRSQCHASIGRLLKNPEALRRAEAFPGLQESAFQGRIREGLIYAHVFDGFKGGSA